MLSSAERISLRSKGGTSGFRAALNPLVGSHIGIHPQHRGLQMSSARRKKPSSPRSGSSRGKRKRGPSGSATKALVNKADHVKRQSPRSNIQVRASGKGSDTTKKPSPEMLPPEATKNARPALAGLAQDLAFWSPMAVLMRQQTLVASMALNLMQSQRLWAQAFSRS